VTRILLVTPWLLKRHTGVGYSATFREMWLRPMLAAAPFALATWLTEQWWPAHDLVSYFTQVAAALPLMAAGTWLVALDAEDRRMLQRAALRRTPWAAPLGDARP
jgi:hypothetical protein